MQVYGSRTPALYKKIVSKVPSPVTAHISRRGTSWPAAYREATERTEAFARKVDAANFLAAMHVGIANGQWMDPRARTVAFQSYAEQWRPCRSTRRGAEPPAKSTSAATSTRSSGSPDRRDTTERDPGLVHRRRRLRTRRAVYRAAGRDLVVAASPCIDIMLPRRSSRAVDEVLEPEPVRRLGDNGPEW